MLSYRRGRRRRGRNVLAKGLQTLFLVELSNFFLAHIVNICSRPFQKQMDMLTKGDTFIWSVRDVLHLLFCTFQTHFDDKVHKSVEESVWPTCLKCPEMDKKFFPLTEKNSDFLVQRMLKRFPVGLMRKEEKEEERKKADNFLFRYFIFLIHFSLPGGWLQPISFFLQ